jgi:hypothetical protein
MCPWLTLESAHVAQVATGLTVAEGVQHRITPGAMRHDDPGWLPPHGSTGIRSRSQRCTRRGRHRPAEA